MRRTWRYGQAWLVFPLALSCETACSMPPPGGVSGTVTDTSGKPIPGAELTLTSTPRVFGIAVPFAEPMRVPTTTDERGHFRVYWSHGDRDEGPLLEVTVQGYVPVAQRLPLGSVECSIVLATAGSQRDHSKATCAARRPTQGLGGSEAPSNNAMQLTRGGWTCVGASWSARSS
jgi:hypothetical protein